MSPAGTKRSQDDLERYGDLRVNIESGSSSFSFTWTEHGIRLVFEAIREDARGITAEVSGSALKSAANRPSTPSRIDLLSHAHRRTTANYLQEVLPVEPGGLWRILLDDATAVIIRNVRQEEPIIRLTSQSSISPPQFRLAPLVYDRLPTVLFTHPGAAKSYLGLFCAMLVQTGGQAGLLVGQPGETLYLDFESDEDDFRYRAHCIRRGHPELQNAAPSYLRCHRPIADSVDLIRRNVERGQCMFLVIDSLGPACGEDLERAETALRFFGALRSLRVSTLLLGHQPKHQGKKKPASIFGSTFFNAMARSSWELQRLPSSPQDVVRLQLEHRKANLSRLLDPLALTLTFGEDSARFDIAGGVTTQTPAAGNAITKDILTTLRDGGVQSAQAVADSLNLELAQVSPRLTELKRTGLVRQPRRGRWEALPVEGAKIAED